METGEGKKDSDVVETMLSKRLTLQEITELTGIKVEEVKKHAKMI